MLILIPVALGASLAFAWLLKPESQEGVARRLVGCVEGLDADCLLRYASPDEISKLDLDRGKLRSLLSHIVSAELAGFERRGGPKIEHNSGDNTVTIIQLLQARDGRETEIMFSVGSRPNGPYCLN